ACRAGNAGASKVLAVLESAQGGREAWIRVSVLTVRVVRSHRQMRLVDRQEAVHERREVVDPRSEASRRTRGVVGTAHGTGGGCARRAGRRAGDARGTERFAKLEPAEGGRETRIRVAVHA